MDFKIWPMWLSGSKLDFEIRGPMQTDGYRIISIQLQSERKWLHDKSSVSIHLLFVYCMYGHICSRQHIIVLKWKVTSIRGPRERGPSKTITDTFQAFNWIIKELATRFKQKNLPFHTLVSKLILKK